MSGDLPIAVAAAEAAAVAATTTTSKPAGSTEYSNPNGVLNTNNLRVAPQTPEGNLNGGGDDLIATEIRPTTASDLRNGGPKKEKAGVSTRRRKPTGKK